VLFTGEYEHTIDTKQRLAVPAEIRGQLEAEQAGDILYLSPGANGALWLWPEQVFERMTTAAEGTLLPGDEVMQFDELMFPYTRRLEIDKNGRVRLPLDMLGEFGLDQTVIILGMRDHLELREPQQWKRQRQDNLAKRREIMQRARESLKGGSVTSNGGGQKDHP
jgi:MraZ protein